MWVGEEFNQFVNCGLIVHEDMQVNVGSVLEEFECLEEAHGFCLVAILFTPHGSVELNAGDLELFDLGVVCDRFLVAGPWLFLEDDRSTSSTDLRVMEVCYRAIYVSM